MKLVRFVGLGEPELGVLNGQRVIPLAPLGFRSMIELIESGAEALAKIKGHLTTAPTGLALNEIRLLAPIVRPGKFLAIGMNYRKHADEAKRLGISAPAKQLWFNKQTSCINGPYDDIVRGVTEKLDYEVELGVVIGPRAAKGVTQPAARGHVYGYFVVNDVSARDWQMHSQTFTVGKSFDTHGPIGPWIVTADEIADPHTLGLRCFVNDALRQESNTSELIFNIWQQIEYLSTAFTLEPGDLLSTGTPEGIGAAMQPPRFLDPGDTVRCEVDGIGAIENKVVA